MGIVVVDGLCRIASRIGGTRLGKVALGGITASIGLLLWLKASLGLLWVRRWEDGLGERRWCRGVGSVVYWKAVIIAKVEVQAVAVRVHDWD